MKLIVLVVLAVIGLIALATAIMVGVSLGILMAYEIMGGKHGSKDSN